jgi:hypothetical protein
MGQVKQARLAHLERDEREWWREALDEDQRWEPELPDPTPEDGQEAPSQDGKLSYPFIFEPRGHYLCDITTCLTHQTARC